MAGLGEKDRNAIVLRFFDGQHLKDVASALGTSEEAAKMRVRRAVEKLRRFFTERGMAHSAAVLAGALSAHSVQAAPSGLSISVAAAAVNGATVTVSTLTLVKGVLNIMAWTKTKTAIVAAAVIILTMGTGVVIVVKVSSSKDPKSQLSRIAPAIDQVRAVNTDLPSPQMEAKTLVFSAFARTASCGRSRRRTPFSRSTRGWRVERSRAFPATRLCSSRRPSQAGTKPAVPNCWPGKTAGLRWPLLTAGR